MKKKTLFFSIAVLFLGISLYEIDKIPGEWYGDISIVHEYVTRILVGQFPLYYEAGGGPAYHYFISPIIYFLDSFFLDYKIASIATGLLGLYFIYLLGKELANTRIGLLSSLLSAVSFWYFMWARSGNYIILTSLLSSMTVYFSLWYFKTGSGKNLISGAVISSLGLLTYPATFILPVVYLSLITYGLAIDKKQPSYKKIILKERINKAGKTLILVILSFLPAIYFFIKIVQKQPGHFTQGYIGSKVFDMVKLSPEEFRNRLLRNIYRTALMLHQEGDVTFRYNVPKSSHLDFVSGIFFSLGILWWLKRREKYWLGFFLVSIFFLSLPSLSPAIPPVEVPNIARSFALFPLIIIITASGVYLVYIQMKKIWREEGLVLLALLFSVTCYLNVYKYFIDFPKSLPNNNIPYGKIVAEYIDSLPENTKVYLAACCWGDWGQPEPKGIYYVLYKNMGRKSMVTDDFIKKCDQIEKGRPVLVIFDPRETEKIKEFHQCFAEGKLEEHRVNDQLVFVSLYLPSGK